MKRKNVFAIMLVISLVISNASIAEDFILSGIKMYQEEPLAIYARLTPNAMDTTGSVQGGIIWEEITGSNISPATWVNDGTNVKLTFNLENTIKESDCAFLWDFGNDSYTITNTSIAGIDGSKIIFTKGESSLKSIEYVFSSYNSSIPDRPMQCYDYMRTNLINKYGKANWEHDGTHFSECDEFDDNPYTTIEDYSEWLIKFDDCYVLIDLFCTGLVIPLFSRVESHYSCSLKYTMYSEEEIIVIQNNTEQKQIQINNEI